MNWVASAFWLGEVGLFNKGTERDFDAEAILLDVVRRDGRSVPEHLWPLLEPGSVLDACRSVQ